MNVRQITVISFLLLLCASSLTQASSHQLGTRQLPDGTYEAVITYSNQDYCFVIAYPPSSIQVIDYDVLITSPGPDNITCIGKTPPPILYEKTALIGELAPGEYTVTWIQDRSFSESTSLRVPGISLSENPIPSSSTSALFLLILGILAVALFASRYRTSA